MAHFEHASVINATAEAVFAFHERPDAIKLLTPAFLFPQMKRLKGQGLEAGVELIITTGLISHWHARHIEYVKNRLFVDEMVSGPMKSWRHEHRFEPMGNQMRLVDTIDYVPIGPTWLAEIGLRLLFRFRHSVTRHHCELTANQALY